MQKTPGESKQSPADNVYAVRLTMRIVFCALCLAYSFPVLLFYLSTYRRTRDRRAHTASGLWPPHFFLFVSFLVWPGTVYSTVTGCLAESISRAARGLAFPPDVSLSLSLSLSRPCLLSPALWASLWPAYHRGRGRK